MKLDETFLEVAYTIIGATALCTAVILQILMLCLLFEAVLG